MTITEPWVDPDDYPEIPSAQFDAATVKVAGKAVNRGGRPKGSDKEKVTIRLDHDVLAHFRAEGAGWQTRLNDALRKAAAL